MRTNVVKYELISLLNDTIESRNYENSLSDTIKDYSFYIKGFESLIYDICERIDFYLIERNKTFIEYELTNLKDIIQQSI